jgi:tetraacyldisaccharide 4'-kinase
MLRALSNIYGYLVNRRNNSFDSNRVNITKLNYPVISVGNISTGGTGKTPFVIMLCEKLLDNGIKAAIAGRGYRRKNKKINIIANGKQILGSLNDAGDEMYMLAQKLNVPIAVHDSKAKAAEILADSFQPDCIIIDDGFQHRWLHRDIDIVLIDEKTLAKPNLIPHGYLREPLASIKRADIIAIVGEVNNYDLIEDHIKDKLVIKVSIKHTKVSELFSNRTVSEDELKNAQKNPVCCSGIANPKKFEASLANSGWQIAHHITFPDHYHYTKQDISKINNICKKYDSDTIITTEKDAVKLRPLENIFNSYELKCYVFSIEMLIIDNEEMFFKKILSVINSK